jgi:PAS domain S-box-containing protein
MDYRSLDQQAASAFALIAATTDFAYLFDLEGRFRFVNPPLLALWGMSIEQAIGKTFFELPYPRELAERLHRQIQQVIHDHSVVRDETRYVSPSGVDGYYEYIFVPVLAADGTLEAVAGTTRDVTERKQTELALLDARARLDVAMLAGEMGTWILDIRDGRVFGDRGLNAIFGLPPDLVNGAKLEQYVAAIHPDDRSGAVHAIARAVHYADTFEAEYRLHNRQGERWVVARGMVERDAQGVPLRLPGVVLDITARKQAELALRASEERYRSLFDNIDQGFCVIEVIVDAAGKPVDYRFLETNLAFARQTGLVSPVGRTARELVPDLEEHWFERYGQIALTGEPESFEAGSISMGRWFTVEAFRVGDASSRRVASLCKDITASKLAEVALQDSEGRLRDLSEQARVSEQRLRGIFDQATAGIVQVDVAGRFLDVNDRFCQIVGLPAEQLYRLSILDITEPEDVEATARSFQHMLETGAPFVLEKRYRGSNGMPIWASSSVSLIRDTAGNPAGAVAVTIDISARRSAEDRLREVAEERERLLEAERTAREEAERTSRIKDEFLATLSHELRTPLNAILGWSQIMKQRVGDPAEVERGLSVIERNARAQAQIIEDLLDMSRIISGKIRLDVQPVDFVALVQSAVETVKPGTDAKGIELSATVGPLQGVTVTGDANRLHQVLWNLLSNAVKFTPKGGRVRVLLDHDDAHLEIQVSDSGEGIAPDFLSFVFDRFRQADATSTRRHGGLGLGLAIVKQLVELHGGTIRVHSDGLGTGTTFTVTLPLVTEADEPERESVEQRRKSLPPAAIPRAHTAELAGLTILVVDDEPDARALVQRLLEDHEARVASAGSVDEAMKLLSGRRFDLVVSDIGMPNEDGYALIRRLRALEPAQGGTTPAIAVTAYARAEDRSKALRAGFQVHLVKPIEPGELISVAASLTGRTERLGTGTP